MKVQKSVIVPLGYGKYVLRDYERGATTVEYAIMLVLIAIAVAAFGVGLTRTVANVFARMVAGLAGAP